MLLAVLALAAGALAGWLSGRRPGFRAGSWRAPALVPAGAALLLAGARFVGGGPGVGCMAAGYSLLTAFAVANARHPGLALVGVGLVANLVVIVANGGMPVRGVPPGLGTGGHHHGLSSRDRLTALSDTVALSALHETVSPGDVVVALGGAVAVFFWLAPAPSTGTGPARRRRRGVPSLGGSAGRE